MNKNKKRVLTIVITAVMPVVACCISGNLGFENDVIAANSQLQQPVVQLFICSNNNDDYFNGQPYLVPGDVLCAALSNDIQVLEYDWYRVDSDGKKTLVKKGGNQYKLTNDDRGFKIELEVIYGDSNNSQIASAVTKTFITDGIIRSSNEDITIKFNKNYSQFDDANIVVRTKKGDAGSVLADLNYKNGNNLYSAGKYFGNLINDKDNQELKKYYPDADFSNYDYWEIPVCLDKKGSYYFVVDIQDGSDEKIFGNSKVFSIQSDTGLNENYDQGIQVDNTVLNNVYNFNVMSSIDFTSAAGNNLGESVVEAQNELSVVQDNYKLMYKLSNIAIEPTYKVDDVSSWTYFPVNEALDLNQDAPYINLAEINDNGDVLKFKTGWLNKKLIDMSSLDGFLNENKTGFEGIDFGTSIDEFKGELSGENNKNLYKTASIKIYDNADLEDANELTVGNIEAGQYVAVTDGNYFMTYPIISVKPGIVNTSMNCDYKIANNTISNIPFGETVDTFLSNLITSTNSRVYIYDKGNISESGPIDILNTTKEKHIEKGMIAVVISGSLKTTYYLHPNRPFILRDTNRDECMKFISNPESLIYVADIPANMTKKEFIDIFNSDFQTTSNGINYSLYDSTGSTELQDNDQVTTGCILRVSNSTGYIYDYRIDTNYEDESDENDIPVLRFNYNIIYDGDKIVKGCFNASNITLEQLKRELVPANSSFEYKVYRVWQKPTGEIEKEELKDTDILENGMVIEVNKIQKDGSKTFFKDYDFEFIDPIVFTNPKFGTIVDTIKGKTIQNIVKGSTVDDLVLTLKQNRNWLGTFDLNSDVSIFDANGNPLNTTGNTDILAEGDKLVINTDGINNIEYTVGKIVDQFDENNPEYVKTQPHYVIVNQGVSKNTGVIKVSFDFIQDNYDFYDYLIQNNKTYNDTFAVIELFKKTVDGDIPCGLVTQENPYSIGTKNVSAIFNVNDDSSLYYVKAFILDSNPNDIQNFADIIAEKSE